MNDSAAPKRDPRVDPKVGDMLLLGAERRAVEEVGLHQVRFVTTAIEHPHSYGISGCSVEKWKRWAQHAEVIRHAD